MEFNEINDNYMKTNENQYRAMIIDGKHQKPVLSNENTWQQMKIIVTATATVQPQLEPQRQPHPQPQPQPPV